MDIQFILNCAFGVISVIISLLLALGGRYLSEIQNNFSAQIAQHDEQLITITNKLDDQGKGFYEFQLRVQRDFVSKADYLYGTEKLDGKLDLLSIQMHKIDKNITRLAAVQGVEDDE